MSTGTENGDMSDSTPQAIALGEDLDVGGKLPS